MRSAKSLWFAGIALVPAALAGVALAASHREAPLTSIDRSADITDFFAFVSPDAENTLTAIMCTDPLLEPANGPNYFPFDPGVIYQINVDNNHDARADLAFAFRFKTEVRVPGIPVGFAGAGNGIGGVIPPQITALDGPGSEGLSLRQSYKVELRSGSQVYPLGRSDGRPLFALPSNVGPRTMDYDRLFPKAVQSVGRGMKVFAGTVDDPFFIDLGAAFDSLNFRAIVLSQNQDEANTNQTPDDVSGYNVNCIAVQMPIRELTANGNLPGSKDPLRQIGLWATTLRAEVTTRASGKPNVEQGRAIQVQRMANPLVNELLIPTERKDQWSRGLPANDRDFLSFVQNPAIVQIGLAAFPSLKPLVPPAPRQDLVAALGQYSSGQPGPFADLLRVDLSIKPTRGGARSRLGGCAGDPGGFPNGRRLLDDVTDCFLRVGFGLLKAQNPAAFPRLGDGANRNDQPLGDRFPYLAPAQDGRGSRHIDPGEPGCVLNGRNVNCPD